MYPFKFDSEKAVEIILYITEKAPIPDIYHVLKILYFADKDHLEQYGRLICGDSYVAMRSGPVPSGTYDIVKDIKDNRVSKFREHSENAFAISGVNILVLRDANLDIFSDSDLECLDSAITEYGPLSFGDLKKRSHDKAFKSADENDFISLNKLVETFPDGDLLNSHLANPYPG